MTIRRSIDDALPDRSAAADVERPGDPVVSEALPEFIARRERKRLLGPLGRLDWDASFDYKAERSRT